jgi:hypothetical protein
MVIKLKIVLQAVIITLFFSCKHEGKPKIDDIENGKSELMKNYNDKKSFDDSNFIDADVSNFLSNNLLIGRQDMFRENNITSLNIRGYQSYQLNDLGLITEVIDMTNNFSEYRYDMKGNPITILYKQHSPKLTYYEENRHYSKNGKLKKVIKTRFNSESKIKKQESFSNSDDLSEIKDLFQKALKFKSYKIDTTRRLILNYRSDLLFCCGRIMEGKNRLLYYYGTNGLIDSLAIKGLNSGKTMSFVYEYE